MVRISSISLALLLLCVQSQPAGDQLHAALEREIARVRGAIGDSVPDQQRAAMDARMARATAALDAGRNDLALFELEPAWEAVDTARFVDANQAVTTQEALQTLWQQKGAPTIDHSRTAASALVEALAASAAGRAPATYRASLPFGRDTGPESGVYYLGDAYAAVAFARFARELPWPSAGTKPAFRSIAGELDAFDREVTTAYETMERSQHPTYMLTSVTLKQARTLNEAGEYGAALLQYLLARYRFGTLRPAGETPTPERVADAATRLPAGIDHSIASLFLEIASTAVSAAEPAARTPARIVVDDVLPAYLAAVVPATLTTAPAGNATTTITLVRWPFT